MLTSPEFALALIAGLAGLLLLTATTFAVISIASSVRELVNALPKPGRYDEVEPIVYVPGDHIKPYPDLAGVDLNPDSSAWRAALTEGAR